MLHEFGLVAGGALLAVGARWAWDEWVWRRTAGLGSELVWAVIRRQQDRDAEDLRFDSDAPPAEDPWDLVIYAEGKPLS